MKTLFVETHNSVCSPGKFHRVSRRAFLSTLTALGASAVSLLKLVPVPHILFGTDFPFSGAGEVSKGLREAGLAAGDLQSIERNNALELFPRLKNRSLG